MFALGESLVCFSLMAQHGFSPADIVISEWVVCLLRLGRNRQDVDALLPQTGLGVVEGQLVVVQRILVHHVLHLLYVALLVEAAIVEAVGLQALLNELECFVFSS